MKLTRFLALAAFALPVLAHAHPGHDGGHDLTWDFTSGATHPLTGWDHWLAMIAVGVWAAQLGGRNRWLVPAAFAAALTLGAVLGQNGIGFVAVETGIAASLLALGLLIAGSVRLGTALSMALVAVFALMHGLAHGAETPSTANGFGYAAGFVLTTLALHCGGVALGLKALAHKKSLQLAGAALTVSGLVAFAV